ncbi:MAG: response regulator [Proteobacteria bacterium]|nr:response regulator [Pseudomonadota bacterium]
MAAAATSTMTADEVKVLVVDDVADELEPLATALRLDGYTVWTAPDGQRALDIVAGQLPHCVILDVNMPGFDGRQLSRRLRDEHGDDIVLIAVTGRDRADPRVTEVFGTVDHYLMKPIDQAALRKVLPRLG